MALTGDQLKPILRAKLREALCRRKPETAVDSWYEWCADNLGISKNTFASWCYGHTFSSQGNAPSSLPQLENWAALRLFFPGIDEEVFGDITGERGDGPDLSEQIAASEALTASLKEKQAPRAPLKAGRA